MFRDILGQLPESTTASASRATNFRAKWRCVQHAALLSRQACVVHNAECRADRRVHVDFSGLPCPDYSKANRKRKYQEGPSALVYLTWAKRHCDNRTPLLIVENVPAALLI